MKNFTVCILTNGGRKRYEIELDEAATLNDITEQLDEAFLSCGYSMIGTRTVHVRLKNKEIVDLGQVDLTSDDIEEIVYARLVKPDNTYEYAYEDGISYYFHTNEGNHMHYPHIHVRLGEGEEVSIYFKDMRVVGEAKNHRGVRQAQKWVAAHMDELIKVWNRIIYSN